MAQELAPCPLCSSERSVLFNEDYFLSTLVTNRLCKRCGLVYQSPRISAQAAEEFHSREYRLKAQAGKAEINPNELAVQRARAASLVELFRKTAKGATRHLDIGCSAGMLMQAFQAAFGCETTGVEVDAMFRPYARGQGLKVYETLDQLPAGRRFDVISMSHVLEHIPDPVTYLRRLSSDYLDRDGWLYLEVPNLYGHVSFEIGHLVCYSPRTLKETLKRAGYRIVKMTRYGRPRSKLIPLYINVVARPASAVQAGPIREHAVRLKWYAARVYRKLCRVLLPKLADLPIPGVVRKAPEGRTTSEARKRG
jgi:2-polyprenyl-3-methyl-5-hydroxy-6-metoxy-1,4-benzoquinol methylase